VSESQLPLEHRRIRANGIDLHTVLAGSGPPVVLLHGFPQTWFCWRRVIPLLVPHFRVIAPDLRGYGESDRPAKGYDKATMAADIRALVQALGHDEITLVGHDRGARVAHRYALDHPQELTGVGLLDILPTDHVFGTMDADLARRYWHWIFHLVPELPEQLIAADVQAYLRSLFVRFGAEPDREGWEEYLRIYRDREAIRGFLSDYRAAYYEDFPRQAQEHASGRRLEVPTLVLWGAQGNLGKDPVLDIWRQRGRRVDGHALDCGHYLPEERPAEVAEEITRLASV
jgi:pimeloyl-ACP methyl ester carboxylesterase